MNEPVTRVGILLYDDFDLIDAGGPYEVFLTASRLVERDGAPACYEVVLMSPDGGSVTAYGGWGVTGTVAAAEAGILDVVIVPGLIDLDQARRNPAISDAVRALASRSTVTASVCTGAFLLADAGLLAGLPATTHWEDVAALTDHSDVAEGITDVRWVDNDSVVTSGGLTSGIHMALHLVDRLHGRDLAERTARQLELPWNPEGSTRRTGS